MFASFIGLYISEIFCKFYFLTCIVKYKIDKDNLVYELRFQPESPVDCFIVE